MRNANGPTASRAPAVYGERGLILTPPAWLEDVAAEMFREAAADLAPTGALRPADRHNLALWAMLMAQATRDMRELAGHPEPSGQEAKRLRVGAFGAVERAARLGTDLGLSPAARVRIGTAQAQVLNMFELLGMDDDNNGPEACE